MTMTVVSLHVETEKEVLAGRVAGEALKQILDRRLRETTRGALVLLDFAGIAHMTSSYFLGGLEWLWALRDPDLFPVVVNAAVEVVEEIELVARARGLKPLLGSAEHGVVTGAEPVNMDEEELRTYRQVERLGEATAADLYRFNPKIQPTGWSNRLALLHEARLLRRRKEGRQLVYSVSWRWPDGRGLYSEA